MNGSISMPIYII